MYHNVSTACRPHRTALLALLLCLAAGLLQSCSPTFLYRHADRLLLWKIDEYADLTSDQKGFVRERLKTLLTQHRKEALPLYERFLIQIKDKSADGLDRQEVEWAFATVQELRADLVARSVPDGSLLLSSLGDEQVRYLERKFERDNEKVARRLTESRDARLTKRASATMDWLKPWLGTLTETQQQRIAALSTALPDMPALALQHRRHRQQTLLKFVRSARDPQVLSGDLENWLLYPERTAVPDYQQASEQMKRSVQDMVLAIDELITTQQRAHALRELQHLIDDVRRLSVS